MHCSTHLLQYRGGKCLLRRIRYNWKFKFRPQESGQDRLARRNCHAVPTGRSIVENLYGTPTTSPPGLSRPNLETGACQRGLAPGDRLSGISFISLKYWMRKVP
jgi:hypothetical protein